MLYSSDAFGLAELYLAGAQQFRWALGRVLDEWVTAGSVPAGEVGRIARGIAGQNARASVQAPSLTFARPAHFSWQWLA